MIFLNSSPILALLLDTEEADRCEDLLSGIEVGDVKAVTNSHVLEETAFKLIFAKASENLQTKNVWVIREELKNDRALRQECSRTLDRFMEYLRTLCLGGLRVVEVHEEDVYKMAEIFEETGLLTSDCLHVAVMRRLGLRRIATLDKDFRQVKELSLLL
ncbi:MAG: type II toxin-antitoxin system VapC family toxin [Candidatus Bathyarchaeia archaeon]